MSLILFICGVIAIPLAVVAIAGPLLSRPQKPTRDGPAPLQSNVPVHGGMRTNGRA